MMTVINDKNNSLFNKRDKIKFLNGVKEGTRQSYERIFKFTSQFESALNKDINLFTKNELETVLRKFEASNRNTIESYARIISSYLNWSVKNNLTPVNLLSDFKPDDFEKYLKNNEEYITEKKLRRYEDQCENYQDAVILRLLFSGVGGKQMSEIRNLKKSHIDFDKMEIKLIESLKEENGIPVKFTERYLKVDRRTLDLIEGAINQKTYSKRNGMMEEINNIRPFTDLVNNEYVIRSSITKTDHINTPVDKFVIYRRIATISETLGIDIKAKFIQRSGMIFQASKLIQDDNISLDDLKIIANQFNIKSYHNLKGFISIDSIRRIYSDEREENK